MKTSNKKSKVGIIVISISIACILVFSVFLNVLSLNKFDNIFEQFIGKTADGVRGDTMGADVDYVKSDFATARELYDYECDLVAEIAQDGITLLENDGLLPLAKGATLSLFSHSSVDLVSGGSGSGSGSFELTLDLKTGLEAAGLKVNETLWNFYKSGKGKSYTRGAGVINYGASLDWKINECPASVIQSDSAVVDSFDGSVAMFVFSRTGGEGGDLARDMAAYGGKSGSHYLEPDETELGVIDYLNREFDNVILLVNCNNAPELGWVKNYPNIKAVLNFPGAGRTGTRGLGYVLTGLDKDGNEISPSGHLVDTFVYDNYSAPAMQNMGDFNYAGTRYYYVNYAEGIYVGYKYYETRYEDVVTERANVGEFDYASSVLYPFGYGKSYTDFAWSNFAITEPDESGKLKVSLTVENIGDRAGKDVVQIYAQTPYTDYDINNGIEKSAISLVGFAKTDLLTASGAGKKQDIEIELDLKDMVSYDARGAHTYILDAGEYYITAASDAHKAINNVLTAKGVPSDKPTGSGDAGFVGMFEIATLDDTTYSKGVDNADVTNRFDYAALDDGKYLSRTDWSVMDGDGLRYGTASNTASGAEIGGKQWTHDITPELKAQLDSRSSRNPAEGTVPKTHTFGAKNDVDLIDLRGLAFDDPLWEKLLDEITLSELALLIDESGYCTPQIKSINKPKVTDLDGPAGLNLVVGHGSADIGNGLKAMTWPSEYMLACSWNAELARKMGEGVGEDGLHGGIVGWYGPGMNIHRTPFAGRNFEYYSEDAFLSGILGRAEVAGAAAKGMYAFIKHFALNDQETHRDHLGIVTWAQEQAIREIYLKPFEMTIVSNNVTIKYNEPIRNEKGDITGYTSKTAEVPAASAVMSSFNRIGATWAGGNYDLLTGVLRNEWGFNGFVLTDYEVSDYMFTEQCLAAGGDAKLKTVGLAGNFLFGYSLKGKPEEQAYARDAAHRILYTVVNSAAMNGYVHGVEFVNGFAYYKIILIVWDVLSAAGIAALAYFLAVKIKRYKNG